MVEPGPASCNYLIHEGQSRIRAEQHLTTHANPAVSEPVIKSGYIMQRTGFGCSQFLLTRRVMVSEMSVFTCHSTTLRGYCPRTFYWVWCTCRRWKVLCPWSRLFYPLYEKYLVQGFVNTSRRNVNLQEVIPLCKDSI